MKDSEITDKDIKEMLRVIVSDMLKSGEINENDLINKKDIYNILSEKIKNFEFKFILDHRSSLSDFANYHLNQKNFDLSIALFATIVEHSLNSIIALSCIQKNISSVTQKNVIQNTNIIGKCTWLLEILGLPPIIKRHVDNIRIISEKRNAYIHYKFQESAENYVIKDNEEFFKKIKLTIKYLKNYESKIIFSGKKSIIDNFLKLEKK